VAACAPVPQVFEQAPNEPQAPTQFTGGGGGGHAFSVQVLVLLW